MTAAKKLNRQILRGNIERMTKGRPLNKGSLKRAVDIAEIAFTGQTGNGQAAEIGLKAVEQDIYKKGN